MTDSNNIPSSKFISVIFFFMLISSILSVYLIVLNSYMKSELFAIKKDMVQQKIIIDKYSETMTIIYNHSDRVNNLEDDFCDLIHDLDSDFVHKHPIWRLSGKVSCK